MEYKIIQGKDAEELEHKVNMAILNGFKPLGGVCGYENVSGRLLQAMTKGDEK